MTFEIFNYIQKRQINDISYKLSSFKIYRSEKLQKDRCKNRSVIFISTQVFSFLEKYVINLAAAID